MASPVTHLQVAPAISPNMSAARMPDGSTRTPTSFGDYGLPDELVGSSFDPHSLFSSRRAAELRYRASFFHCRQHDGKRYGWDGSALGPAEERTTQPFIGASQPSQFIPLSLRRPAVPYRLGRKVVLGFTDFLFGQGRWPQLRSNDPDTQAAAEALFKAGDVPSRFIQARNLGGASGTAGLSWRFVDGKPVVRAHSGQSVHVVSWVDEDSCIPAHVVELRQKIRLAVDPEDGVLKPTLFWLRRDWTLQGDVTFEPCRAVSKDPLVWRVDEVESRVHDDGFCHFVWIQNRPSEDETEDGTPDYAETYEQQDGLDILNSTNFKGVNLNLDPTLALTLADDEQSFTTIKKGSDHAIVMKLGGSAEYLQLNDTEIGERTINLQRSQILEVTGCVLVDPEKAAAAASSGEAQRMIYAPMIAATDVLRISWGPAIAALANQMLRSWRRLKTVPVQVPVPANDTEIPVVDGETDEPVVEYEEYPQDLALPPRQVIEPGVDGGEDVVTSIEHSPGSGDIEVEWGPYFKPSGDDKQKIVGTVGTAAGGKPVLSQKTAVEIASNLLDVDAAEEWRAVQEEAAAAKQDEADMLDPQQRNGAGADDPDAVSPGNKDQVRTVNEIRAKMGVGPLLLPDGSPDPDGQVAFAAWLAKVEAQGAAGGGSDTTPFPAQAPPGAKPPSPVEDDDLPVPPPRPLPGME